MGLCTGAQFIAGPHRADEAARLHAAKVYLQPLERLAIFDADPIPRLALRPRPPFRQPSALSPQPSGPSSRQRQRAQELAGAEMGGVAAAPDGTRLTSICSSWAGKQKASGCNAWPQRCRPRARKWRRVCRWRSWRTGWQAAARSSATTRAFRTSLRQWACRAWSCGVTRRKKSGGPREKGDCASSSCRFGPAAGGGSRGAVARFVGAS